MSLVGTLEEMGLADLFQLFSLSRKSGVLWLTRKGDSGCIVFRDGRIGGAAVRGGPRGLRAVLLEGGLLTARDFERAHEHACSQRVSVAEAIVDLFGHSFDRIESLCRETVETAVLTMLAWPDADFHFSTGSEPGQQDPEILTPSGIDPQYLAMESARRQDEASHAAAPSNERLPASDANPAVSEFPAVLDREENDFDLDEESNSERRGLESADLQSASPLQGAESSGAADASDGGRRVLVLVDDDLACMEWIKRTLCEDFDAIHIFQQTDLALSRIRQYLVRGTYPVVLICPDVSVDWLGGYRDTQHFIGRLKAQSSRVRVYGLLPESGQEDHELDGVDGVVRRPRSPLFGGSKQAWERELLAQALRKSLGRCGH